MQTPLTQIPPEEQMLPQRPQLSGSVVVSVQRPRQLVEPGGQEQELQLVVLVLQLVNVQVLEHPLGKFVSGIHSPQPGTHRWAGRANAS